MNALHELVAIGGSTINSYLDGQRVIGYFCSYVPEELLHAAGMVPYRMRAVESTGTAAGDAYFSPLNCSLVRHSFSKILDGDYDFLDGIVFMNGCDHSRRLYDNFRHANKSMKFVHMLPVPHVTDDVALGHYLHELYRLRDALPDPGSANPDSLLRESIALYNKKRSLLAQVATSRNGNAVPIRGSEFLAMMLAVTALPVEESIRLLEGVIDELPGRDLSDPDAVRLLIAGNCLEEVEYLKLIEDCGGSIVADTLCLGSRYYHDLVDESIDPMLALARRYLSHQSCPRMSGGYGSRLAFMEQAIVDYRVDAVILDKLEFCTHAIADFALYHQHLKSIAVPSIVMDREYGSGSSGQIKTRLQAFFEKVSNRRERIG